MNRLQYFPELVIYIVNIHELRNQRNDWNDWFRQLSRASSVYYLVSLFVFMNPTVPKMANIRYMKCYQKLLCTNQLFPDPDTSVINC